MVGIGAFAAVAGLLLSGCASTGTIGSAAGFPASTGDGRPKVDVVLTSVTVAAR
jgi:hypothetical protein